MNVDPGNNPHEMLKPFEEGLMAAFRLGGTGCSTNAQKWSNLVVRWSREIQSHHEEVLSRELTLNLLQPKAQPASCGNSRKEGVILTEVRRQPSAGS